MVKVKPVQNGRTSRMSFSRINEVIGMPNLIEIQKNSYNWFLDEGLREVFHDIDAIEDYTGNLSLEFVDYRLDKHPKYTIKECKERDATYAAPLYVTARLLNKSTGEVKEQEIFMGDFPLMTDSGTFISNGAERVIVSQLVRSPGVFYASSKDRTGKDLFTATMNPNRGAWLEYETDSSDVYYVRIDKNRKLPVTTFLRALGLGTDEQIRQYFGDSEPKINATLEKDITHSTEEALLECYRKLRPGEPPTVESSRSHINLLFFDPRRYDLARFGRFKMNNKLCLSRRIAGYKTAEDIIAPLTGELLAAKGEKITVVLDRTPFYAEMGGQIGDTGVIRCGEAVFEVTDVQKNKGGKFMHTGKVIHGSFQLGDTVTASIDVERRMAIRRSHTATHLLDAALKAVLGDHVHQAGSLVEPDRLRFDFTHFESITPEQLLAVDTFVNDAILRGIPVVTEVLPIEEAKKKGAVAMFGEKYGDVVRVVEMGDVSMEFCGGTHLDNTAKVGLFRIKSEGSVASGVRRIEAITGKQTLEELRSGQEKLIRAAQLLKTTSNELESRIGGMLSEMKEIKSQLEKFKEQASLGEARTFLTSAKEVKGLKLVTAQRDGMDANALRKLGDFLRDKEPKIVGVLASVNEGKVTLLAVCGKEAVASGVKAGDIIKAIAPICGGKGGGKPDSAMGGGTEVSKVDDALAAVDDLILSKLG